MTAGTPGFQAVRIRDEDIQDKDYSSYDVVELSLDGVRFFVTEEFEKLLGIVFMKDRASWIINADRNSQELGEFKQLKITLVDSKLKFEVLKTDEYTYVGETAVSIFEDTVKGLIRLKPPEYYSFQSFENLDPLEIGHEYMLVASGNRKISVSHECSVKSIKVGGSVIEITLQRDYELSYGPEDESLVQMGQRFTLQFEGAEVVSNPVNDREDKFENITAISDLTPFELSDEEKEQGYLLGIEVNGWEDGRWDIYYKTARVVVEPSEQDEADMEQIKQHLEQAKAEMPPDIVKAHEHSSHNKEEIQRSKLCGCFSCLRIFQPSEIIQWGYVVNPMDFAVCPYCEIDSVIGDASGYPVTEEFLRSMHKYWF